ncbi:cytochrome P450 [Peribacillus castrilensis]|nr:MULTISPECIES: cytochrome P450 [Bacillaceae]MCP1095260.1 cytochrome P450 [Bacillaceae bacterium OS4b]MBD8587633.1 cytochrome P450 [Peribacillus simplex]MCF7624063.1 cytochrome P450 [Peribacillus frigoritolerans]MCP1154618.1 cytochrome P450 [Peribacillus frigoritolerans]MCT1389922.1 cytochrome P450 [Peribacillus frigoritolerans]
MMKEVIAVKEITRFKTRAEEFSPYAWCKRMLENDPVSYHEGTDTWNVFKYEDVKRVLSDYKHFSSVRKRTTISVGTDSEEGSVPEKIQITESDPPDHRKRRSLLAAAFTPRSLQNWEPRIQEIADELIGQMDEGTEIDIVASLASPLPIIVMADLMGVPSKDRLLFKKWVDTLFLPFDREKQEEVDKLKQVAAKEYYQYLYPIVVQKRLNPADDIISDLLKSEVDGEMFTDDEVVRTTMLILGAGVETTSHLLANSFYSLLYDDREVYQELHENLDLVPQAVEEMLRFRFNLIKLDRTVKEDNDLLGVELKEGDSVVVWMSAANMDEEMFEDPFTLNIHRPNNKKHLTFGNGPHFCLGAPLARLEAKIALTAFLKKFKHIEAVPSFQLEENLTDSATGQTLTSLPLKASRM